jgi:hypothetical protein
MFWSLIPAQSAPTTGEGPTVNFEFTGLEAALGSSSFDPDSCVSTFISIAAVQEPGMENGPGPRFAFVYENAFNVCTLEKLSSAFGSVALSPEQFIIDKSLGSAALKATVPLYDQINGTTINVGIDLNWAATSDPEASRTISRAVFLDGTRVFTRSNGTSRDANVSGSAANLNLTLPTGGVVESVKDGQLTLTR